MATSGVGCTNFEYIELAIGGGAGWITLSRPERRNAMNLAAQAELREALLLCAGENVKVVVLTGSGPAFCAGVDLKERRTLLGDGSEESILADHGNSWVATNLAITDHPAVVLAAVNGYALGGGLTLVNSCDLAIAACEAELGIPEISFGAFPGYSGPSTQWRIVSKAAAWLVLTGERIDGRRAVELGLVNRSVPLAQLIEEVRELVDRLCKFEAAALRMCKSGLRDIPRRAASYREYLEYGALYAHELRVVRNPFAGTQRDDSNFH